MKTLLLSTALAGLSATALMAQDGPFRTATDTAEIYASDFIGMRVYAAEAALENPAANGVGADWQDIGEINDVILSREGGVEAVLVDIGGFLGVGERQVAVDMGSLQFVSDDATADNMNDFFLVLTAGRDVLDAAPAYERNAGMMDDGEAAADVDTSVAAGTNDAPAEAVTGEAMVSDAEGNSTAGTDAATEDMAATEAPADGTMATEDTATEDMAATDAPADGTMTTEDTATEDMAATDEATPMAEPIIRDGYAAATPEMMTTETLTGATVYDVNDEAVGEIGELVIDDAGTITQAVVDVGGFLGIGEKPVAVDFSSMQILSEGTSGSLRVYLPQTKEELEAMPQHTLAN